MRDIFISLIFFAKCLDNQNIYLSLQRFDYPNMKDMIQLDFKKVRKLLPYGAINLLSEKTGISKGDISRIFNGLECKSSAKLEKPVLELLNNIKDNISDILSDIKR